MSISLFEDSLFKNPNTVSPFRQSSHLKGNQIKMLANLEQLANAGGPAEGSPTAAPEQ